MSQLVFNIQQLLSNCNLFLKKKQSILVKLASVGLIALFASSHLSANTPKKVNKTNSQEIKCNAFELKHKNCLLKLKEIQFAVTKDKINYFDGVDRQLIDFPAITGSVEWVLVSLNVFDSSQTLLQVKLWQDSTEVEKEPIGLQKLNWYVFNVKQNLNSKTLELAHHGVLQKRRKDNLGASDPIKKHNVELNSAGKIVITHDATQKVIEGR